MPKILTHWDKARIEALTALWAQGLTASEIASYLGGTTRNAVLGKVHRLGLPERRRRQPRLRTPRRKRPRRPPTYRWRPKPHVWLPAFLPAEPEPVSRGLSLFDLNESTCKWAHGDPIAADFSGFCGHPTAPGSAYCAHHHKRAHRPSSYPLGTKEFHR